MSTTEDRAAAIGVADRKALAAKGHAMPDGSYPITDASHVKAAVALVGKSKKYSTAQVKAHIIKNAKRIGATNMLPKEWIGDSQQEQNNSADPPRDELVRAVFEGGVELRESNGDGRLGTLAGHFATFNRWTKIDSVYEGKFMEQVAPGAFAKTFAENRGGMRALFQHGKDPQVGDKPLGPIEVLREDDQGAYYEVPLLDTTYNRDLIPGLEAGLYGASFRFRVMRQKIDKNAPRSDMNPDGHPQRTLHEVGVKEFGPVTFPAYEGATAGMRSMTDEFILASLLKDPDRLRRLVEYMPQERSEESDEESDTAPRYDAELDAPLETRRTSGAPVSGRRGEPGKPYIYGTQRRREPSWLLP